MDRSSSVEPQRPSLFREDLEANLRLVEALAPVHCRDCGGYHLDRARRRARGPAPEALDRPHMVQLLQGWLAERLPGQGTLDFLIAGSGDTNLLATCAEALAGGALQARYTVLDRCQTPLELCAAFGREHRLGVRTLRMDMAAPEGPFAADVIIVHSLLRFLPRAAHVPAMRTLHRWLKPGGIMLFSHRLMSEGCDERAEYGSVDPLRRLFAEAGLRIVALQEHIEDSACVAGRAPRHRVLAVLQSADQLAPENPPRRAAQDISLDRDVERNR
ncbi:MAG TPA: class I SAM-dependent methyltransferase [Dongiaceae bacterium]|jgi:SAM-dependent methyltransferase